MEREEREEREREKGGVMGWCGAGAVPQRAV
jgi:hypothetical protein